MRFAGHNLAVLEEEEGVSCGWVGAEADADLGFGLVTCGGFGVGG